MIPDTHSAFALRLETNELIERARFTALLAAIEEALRESGITGKDSTLAVGGVKHGSVELVLGVVGTAMGAAMGAASLLLAVPGFLVSLRDLARKGADQPNSFADALGAVMALDGVTRAEFRHRDTTISIERSEVPRALSILAGAPGDAPFAREDDGAPEFEYEPSPAGYVSSLMLVGEFENMTGRDGSPEIRFVPRDSTLAHYFVVTRGAEAGSYQEMVDYEVTGNVTLTPEKGATIDVLSIMPPRGALLTRPG